MLTPKIYAIHEASPLSADAVMWTQKEAGTKVIHLLTDMANRSEQTRVDDARSSLPAIRQNYFNNVILIDGERGVGKTALLVSIIDAITRAHKVRGRYAPPTGTTSGDQEAREWLFGRPGWQPAFSVDDIHHALVPVGIIDLQPLPPSTELLLHILSQFHSLLHRTEERPLRAEWEPLAGDEQSAVLFRRLLFAAAAGWSKDYGVAVDIETKAAELEEAAKKRLGILSLLPMFLDALAEDYRKQLNIRPVFVLAIDDADMNLERSRELVPLLRLFLHPRLALILTGNTTLFERSQREDYDRAFEHLTSGPAESDFIEQTFERNRHASDLVNKSIPPSQRCKVRSIVGSKPLQRFIASNPAILSPFELPNTSSDTERLSDVFKEVPLFFSAFSGRLRDMLAVASDFQSVILEWETSGTTISTARAVWYIALQAAERASVKAVNAGLTPQVQHDRRHDGLIITGIMSDKAGSSPLLRQLDEYGQVELPCTPPSTSAVRLCVCPDTFAWSSLGWEELEAAFALASWVGASQRSRLFAGPGISNGREGWFGWGRVQPPEGAHYSIFWPSPEHWPTYDVAAKALRWRAWIDRYSPYFFKRSDIQSAELMLRAFLTLWRTGALGSPETIGSLAQLSSGLATPPPYAALESRLNAWLLDTALLAAPEYGLPADVANAWLHAFLSTRAKEAKPLAGMLVEKRLRMLQFAMTDTGQPNAVQSARRSSWGVAEQSVTVEFSKVEAARLDTAFPAHRWSSHIPQLANSKL